jgi:hypothetical protein
LPAENAPGEPAITTQQMSLSTLALSRAIAIVWYIAAVSAFFLSGRFIRTVRIGPSSMTLT